MIRDNSYIVGEAGAARRIQGAEITPEFFQTLGIALVKGATFTDAELNYGRRHRRDYHRSILARLLWGRFQCSRPDFPDGRPGHSSHWRFARGISLPVEQGANLSPPLSFPGNARLW